MISIEQIYEQLEWYNLNNDDTQELAIKIWSNIDMYDDSRGAFSTWCNQIVRHFHIDHSRSAEYKIDKATDVISEYDRMGEHGPMNVVLDMLHSNESSPDSDLIRQEEEQKLLERLKTLPEIYQETLREYVSGEFDGSTSSNRSRLMRAKKALLGNKGFKYKLINTETKEEYFIYSFAEAGEISGMTTERTRQAYNTGGLFGKKIWRISGI